VDERRLRIVEKPPTVTFLLVTHRNISSSERRAVRGNSIAMRDPEGNEFCVS